MQWLILISLCFATFSANSKVQEQPLEQLLKIEIAAYQLSSAFSAYVLFIGSPRFSQKLESIIATNSPIVANAQSTYPDIADKWQESLSFIKRNKELVFNTDDNRLIIGLFISQNQLYQLIYREKESIVQSSPKAAAPALNEYLNTRVSFERVMAQYMANSASSAGFVHNDTSIEDNVADFSSRIENLTNKNINSQRLNLKWKFVKNNMMKEPGQTSPFITLHTATDIRKMLQRMYKSELVAKQ
jgi:hypothetical protein